MVCKVRVSEKSWLGFSDAPCNPLASKAPVASCPKHSTSVLRELYSQSVSAAFRSRSPCTGTYDGCAAHALSYSCISLGRVDGSSVYAVMPKEEIPGRKHGVIFIDLDAFSECSKRSSTCTVESLRGHQAQQRQVPDALFSSHKPPIRHSSILPEGTDRCLLLGDEILY